MPNEIIDLLSLIYKPLIYASKKDFINLPKIKDLEANIHTACTKILSNNPPEEIINAVEKIKIIFNDFEDSDLEVQKKKITDVLVILNNIRELDANIESGTLSNKDLDVTANIRFIKGVGPKTASLLNKKSIFNVEDLLFYSPKRYDDRRNIAKISDVIPDTISTVTGEILLLGEVRTKRFKYFQVVISDNSAQLKLIWFNYKNSFMRAAFKKGQKLIVRGKIEFSKYDRLLQVIHPLFEDIEIIDDLKNNDEYSLQFGRIVPVYSLTEGISQKKLRKLIYSTLKNYSIFYNNLIPGNVIDENNLINLKDALENAHFPKDDNDLVNFEDKTDIYNSSAVKTVIFFEFFILELGLSIKKINLNNNKGIKFNKDSNLVKRLLDNLPFELTNAQIRVINEIKNNMSSDISMNRLLQGDVGSGKTIVSITAILRAIDSGYQVAMMVPTEILAEQHYSNIKKFTSKLDIKVDLLKSALNKKEKLKIYKSIQSGNSNLVIGTHALIQEVVVFNKLGLVIIDEQHRFGVLQRANLLSKGEFPDVLVMTATPIPRTLAITVYGDLDISIIDELPPNRKNVKTINLKDTKKNREECYEIVKKELQKGRQAYFVYPFIDESENPDFKNVRYVTKMSEELQNDIFKNYRIGVLHGKMTSADKENVMNDFLENKYQILISTTVIEVGVDVPNATIMVIENAERFGLSQLHQLRGRIGRGDFESACILISSYKSGEDSVRRLGIMTETNDGFKISEADLEIRGPGEFMGTRQSGMPNFKFADLLRDHKILEESRTAAFRVTREHDFKNKYKRLVEYTLRKWGEMLEINSIS